MTSWFDIEEITIELVKQFVAKVLTLDLCALTDIIVDAF